MCTEKSWYGIVTASGHYTCSRRDYVCRLLAAKAATVNMANYTIKTRFLWYNNRKRLLYGTRRDYVCRLLAAKAATANMANYVKAKTGAAEKQQNFVAAPVLRRK